MMFVVFDLDGTLALIEHRRHFIAGPKKDYDAFFDACWEDAANTPAIAALTAFMAYGHRVEIWSGRSDRVRKQTSDWLYQNGVPPSFLTRMRRDGDYTKDYVLKETWLKESDPRPDLIFDDRQSVVDMWRRNGVACFQVAPGDFDAPKIITPHPRYTGGEPLLHLLIGPSGAGKTTYAAVNFDPRMVLSSDHFRTMLDDDWKSQARNADVFRSMQLIAAARLAGGVPTVIDATNIKRKDRLAFVNLAQPHVHVRYHVIDRPLAEKVTTGGWRNEVKIGEETLIERHHAVMASNLADILAGDSRPNVSVLDMRDTLGLAA